MKLISLIFQSISSNVFFYLAKLHCICVFPFATAKVNGDVYFSGSCLANVSWLTMQTFLKLGDVGNINIDLESLICYLHWGKKTRSKAISCHNHNFRCSMQAVHLPGCWGCCSSSNCPSNKRPLQKRSRITH